MGLLTADKVAQVLAKGGSARVDRDIAARFAAGDKVICRVINPRGHTRLPRYARGRIGTVARDHGVFVFPDSNATTGDPDPCHLYSVRFEGQELWGPDGAPRQAVYIDLFEPYLDPLDPNGGGEPTP